MENIKCTKCGYIFEYSGENKIYTCPLCSSEIDVNEGVEKFDSQDKKIQGEFKKKSTGRILLDWAIFGIAFSAFIVILYFIFNFIVNYG